MEEKLATSGAQDTNEAPQSLEAESGATTPAPPQENSLMTVPVKFNKEIKELSVDEAAVLAQKGMKYDLISRDLARLKALAADKGKNISDYLTEIENGEAAAHKKALLDRCGGNQEMVEHILLLEQGADKLDSGLQELMAEFPDIKSADDLPEEVLDSVKEKNGNYLDEYLRYLHRQSRKIETANSKSRLSADASVGSQNRYIGDDMSNTGLEFIKGLWS